MGLAMVLLSAVCSAYGQSREVKGSVTDSDGGTLPGVTILSEDGVGTVSDIDGAFSISLDAGVKTLKFSYVGFLTQEVDISNRTVVDISLEPDTEMLEDVVVVTALGISRKKESLGYAVTELDGEELAEVKSLNAVNSLSGKVAGVDISQPNTGAGGSSKVIIRGNSKISGTNQPLYVIDGVPMDNGSLGEAGQYGGQDLGDGISSVNPDDIESISVLKGPAAAALYGSRAGNGVIMITTKKWKENGGNKFDVGFSSYFTADQVVGQYDDVQRIYGQGGGTPPKNQGDATFMNSWGAKLDPNLEFVQFDGQIRDYGIKPDNIKSFFRTGTTLQNSVNFSGGNEFANFRFSASDVRMEDIVPNSGLRRNTFNLHGSMKMWDKLDLDTKITYTNENVDNRPYLGYSGANSALPLMQLPANIDQNWLREGRVDDNGDYIYWNSSTRIINPYYSLYNMKNESDKNRVQGYMALTYHFTDWLDLRVKSGLDTYSYKYYNYAPKTTPTQEDGQMTELNARTTELNSEFLLTATKTFGYFDGSLSLGGNSRQYESSTTNVLGKGELASGIVSINNYNEFTMTKQNPRLEINSFYAFLNLGYKNFAFIDVTARQDWNSTLPADNNSVLYPSFTGSLVLSEALDIKSKLLSYAKLRASYAEVGNGTEPYGLQRSFYGFPYALDGVSFTTQSGNLIPNKDLRASLTKGYEFGIDAKLLNWRVGLDVTYYNQTTHDEIVQLPISLSSGGRDYMLVNAGEINNKGWEAMLNIVPIKTSNLRWDLTFNYSRNRNSIVKLHESAKTQEIARADWVSSFIRAEEGGSYGDIMGYDFKRMEDGTPIVGANGMPIRSDEQIVIGNGQYKWIGGITNKVSYKGFTLRAHIDARFGADILSMTNMKLTQWGNHVQTLEGREGWSQSELERNKAGIDLNSWDATGGYLMAGKVEIPAVDTNNNPIVDENGNQVYDYVDNTTYVDPRLYWGQVANSAITAPFVYDASYVKLREVSLSYTLPNDLLKNSKFIKGATISAIGRNLWLIWSSVPNIDPESTYSISNGQGYEYGSLPQRRSLGFNIKLNF